MKNNKFSNLNERKNIDKDNNDSEKFEGVSEDVIIGRNSCLEAIKSDRTINKLMVSKGEKEGSIKSIISAAIKKGIVVQEVLKVKLDEISNNGSHQGCIALVSPKDYVEVQDILDLAREKKEDPFIIILDGLNDSHNLGSVIRTANAAGAHGVIIPKRRSVALSTTVAKVAAGALEYVLVSRVTNISKTIEFLQSQGVWIFGTDAKGDKSIFESNLKGSIAIVIGSEGEGISSLVSKNCDFLVNIPMNGEISSLNASVAAAISIYEIVRQRRS